MLPEQPLTVAQACRFLGVSERTLRRILRQPEIQAKILAQHRHTATGMRRSSLLPPELIKDLQQAKTVEVIDQQAIQADAGKTPDATVFAYERLLAEQASRIADLQQTLSLERKRLQQVTDLLTETQQDLSRHIELYKVRDARKPILSLWRRLVDRRR